MTIEGLDDLIKDLQKFADVAGKDVARACNDASTILYAKTVEMAPVYAGRGKKKQAHAGTLKNSIIMVKARNNKKTHKYMARVAFKPEAWYGAKVELGHAIRSNVKGKRVKTGEATPRPFMRPAFDAVGESIANMLVIRIGQIHDKFVGGHP